jgi:S-adenosylmethionine synthetase
MRNIVIEKGDYLPIEEREVEIVEKKGFAIQIQFAIWFANQFHKL